MTESSVLMVNLARVNYAGGLHDSVRIAKMCVCIFIVEMPFSDCLLISSTALKCSSADVRMTFADFFVYLR